MKALKFTALALGALLSAPFSKAQQADWYVSAGLGVNVAGAFDQTGFNNDTICYPNFVCDSPPAGFRWFYGLEPDTGGALEFALGRAFNDWHVELAATRLDNGVDQQFTGIEHLDGTPLRFMEQNDYRIETRASAGDLRIHSLSLNVYRNLASMGDWTPYLGAGLGAAQAEITEVYFEERYTCVSEACQGRPAGEFDSLQRADLAETVYTAQVFAGADYDIGENTQLGLELTWRHIDEVSDTDTYLEHAPPALTNTNTFGKTSHWSLGIQLKRFFGD